MSDVQMRGEGGFGLKEDDSKPVAKAKQKAQAAEGLADQGQEEDAFESSASNLFLRSPVCLYICASDDLRGSYLEGYAHTVQSYSEFENTGDAFGALAVTGFVSGWGTLGGLFFWKLPIFTSVAAVGCKSISRPDP